MGEFATGLFINIISAAIVLVVDRFDCRFKGSELTDKLAILWHLKLAIIFSRGYR